MTSTLGRGLIGTELEEATYAVDLEVLDRYQAFSAELLRLSLLGITGYGFLISKLFSKDSEGGILLTRIGANSTLMAVGAVSLGIAAAASLGHRYFSTDALTHQVSVLRWRRKLKDGLRDAELEHANSSQAGEQRALRRDLKRSRWLILMATLFLLVGSVCVAATFALILS